MKKKTKKLVLATETLRSLEQQELKVVDGAKPPYPITREDSCTIC